MKKLIVVLISMSVLIFSNFAMASVHGMWNMETIEKRSLKIGKAKPAIEIENFSDVWVFKDNGTFEFKENASSATPLFVGTWSQTGSNFKISLDSEQIRIFIESELLSKGLPASPTIKKLHFFGSEKKNWTIKGAWQDVLANRARAAQHGVAGDKLAAVQAQIDVETRTLAELKTALAAGDRAKVIEKSIATKPAFSKLFSMFGDFASVTGA